MAGNPKIGLDNVYVAPMIDGSDVTGGTATYGTPVKLAGAVNATLNPNGSVASDWGDNGAFFVGNARGNLQMDLELIDIDPTVKTAILGQTRANGITAESATDQSPWYAMGFRVWLGGKDSSGNNIYEYFWLLKGKFSVPEEGGDTFKGSLSYGHTKMSAEFARLVSNGNILTRARTDYGVATATISAWFNSPVVTTTVNTSPVTCAISANDTANTVYFSFTKADGSAFSMAESSAIVGSTIIVVKNGVSQPGTLYWAGEGSTNPNFTFTPTTLFTGAVTVLATCVGVKDANGVTVTPISASLTFTA